MQRQPAERLVVVLDSENVFKSIAEWSVKWWRHGWRCSTGEVGHKDLWERILLLQEMGKGHVLVGWVPLHLGLLGNEEVGALALLGRHLHSNNLLPLSKRHRVTV